MKPIPRIKTALALLLAAAVLAGCSKNPVTGEREFAPYSTRDEIDLGKQHYGPLQQAQGGPFKTDPRPAAYGQRVTRTSIKRSRPRFQRHNANSIRAEQDTRIETEMG